MRAMLRACPGWSFRALWRRSRRFARSAGFAPARSTGCLPKTIQRASSARALRRFQQDWLHPALTHARASWPGEAQEQASLLAVEARLVVEVVGSAPLKLLATTE